MNKPTKITLVTVVVIIAFAAGGVVGKVAFSDRSNNETPNNNSTQAANNEVKAQDLVSLLKQPSTAIGKTVSVSGNVYKVDKDYYLIQPVDKVKQGQSNAIELDNGAAKIDLDKYASTGSTDKNAKPTDAKANLVKVTITGTVAQAGNGLKLMISSLKAD
jgi:hypothetical protein